MTIAPGFALDPAGNELCVAAPCSLALPAAGGALLITIAYRERPCRPVPTAGGATDPGGDAASALRTSRIVETFDATLAIAPRPMPSRSRGSTASAAAGGSIRRSSRLAFGAEEAAATTPHTGGLAVHPFGSTFRRKPLPRAERPSEIHDADQQSRRVGIKKTLGWVALLLRGRPRRARPPLHGRSTGADRALESTRIST